MSVVASETSPLNCHWIAWEHTLPVCRRPPGPPHRVTEAECAVCDFWREGDDPPADHTTERVPTRPTARHSDEPDPLNRESCPRCGSHDVVLMQRDAVVQSFSCSICHQRWLATRPWPLLRDTRSHRSER